MEYLPLFGSVLLIHLLAVMSPGPDFVMALRNSLTYSRKTGIYTAIGFGIGIGVHVFYCVFGLALIISTSELAFNIIKYLGVAYLIYIGVISIVSKTKDIDVDKEFHKKDINPLKAIRIGFLTNVLNPKATLFFLSLFTFVIGPDVPKNIVWFLGVMMMINTALWFSFVAIFFTQKRVRALFNRNQKVFNLIFGFLLITIALKIVFT
ncbi:MAG: LysE family translocator [Flavobacteriales bacterium]|nr:LysE family translocator [Flavobacteriales bacterium]MCB9364326.1 LysE family translocator [Flavobacteriales bacterium]